MQKMSGKICDSCRTMFYPGDTIIELCPKCANTVWCVTNVYEDNFRELASIHRTKESAEQWIKYINILTNKNAHNEEVKIIKQDISEWCVLEQF